MNHEHITLIRKTDTETVSKAQYQELYERYETLLKDYNDLEKLLDNAHNMLDEQASMIEDLLDINDVPSSSSSNYEHTEDSYYTHSAELTRSGGFKSTPIKPRKFDGISFRTNPAKGRFGISLKFKD